MRTICPNLECLQDYQVKSEALGKLTQCKQCNTVFRVEESPEVNISDFIDGFDDAENSFDETEEESLEPTPNSSTSSPKKRRTKEIIADKIRQITQSIHAIQPEIIKAYERGDNESDTRALIDRILKEALGYSEDEIKRECKVYANRIDYVISIKGQESLVIEAKAIGKSLGKTAVEQATSYGVLAGIRWVLLTNGVVWKLYRTSDNSNPPHDLIFVIELLDGLDSEEAEQFYLISKHGLGRSHLLEKRWQKIAALSPENITEALLSDDVVNKVRLTLTKQTGYHVTNEEIAHALRSQIC